MSAGGLEFSLQSDERAPECAADPAGEQQPVEEAGVAILDRAVTKLQQTVLVVSGAEAFSEVTP